MGATDSKWKSYVSSHSKRGGSGSTRRVTNTRANNAIGGGANLRSTFVHPDNKTEGRSVVGQRVL